MPITLFLRTKDGTKESEYLGTSTVDVGEEIQVDDMTVVIKYVDTDAEGEVIRIEATEKGFDEEEKQIPFLL